MGRAKLMTDLTFRLAADTAQLKKGLSSARREMGTMQKTTQKLGGILAGAFAGQALIAGIGKAIKSIAELEKTIKRTSLIAGGGEEAFADLAKQLGGSTVFTANEAAGAMGFLAQAGFTVDEVLSSTAGVLDLAAAAQLDLAQAADITSNVLSGFGMNASEVNRVNDILVTTTNSANLNVEMLAESFKMVAPIAKSAGISINKAAGFIGVLGDAGIQGTMAGTQLKGAIAQLINPTAKGAAVMKRLGVEVSKTEDGGLDLSKTLQDLKEAGLTTKDAFQLFGKIAATGALVMADATEKADELAIATAKIGVAGDQAREQMNTLAGDMALFSSSVDAAVLKGGAFNLLMRKLYQDSNLLVSAITGQEDSLQSLENQLAVATKRNEELNESWFSFGTAARESHIDDLTTKIREMKFAMKLAGVETEITTSLLEKENEEIDKNVPLTEEQIAAIKKLAAEKKKAAKEEEERTGIKGKFNPLKIFGIPNIKVVDEAGKKINNSVRGTLEERTKVIQEYTAEELAEFQAAEDLKQSIIQNSFMVFSELANTIHGIKMSNIQSALTAELTALEVTAAAKIASGGNELQITKKLEADKAKIQLKYAKEQKKQAISNAIINGALAITKTFATLGFTPAAWVMAAAGAAMTGIQVGAISSQKLANGGVTTGGITTVGERGAEAVALPTGSRVLSHPDTMKAMGGGGGGGKVIIPSVRLKGEDIWLSFTEANRKLGNTLG